MMDMRQALLYKPQGVGGDGWNASADPRLQQNNFKGIASLPMGVGPNFGRIGGGFLGMGVSTPMSIGFNPYSGAPTPMHDVGAVYSPVNRTPSPPSVQWSNPDGNRGGGWGGQSDGGYGGYSDGQVSDGYGGGE